MTKKKVLLPLDGSDFSNAILPHIKTLIKPEDAELILLRITDWPMTIGAKPSALASLYWLYPLPYEPFESGLRGDDDTDWAKHPVYETEESQQIRAMLIRELNESIKQMQEAGYEVRAAVEFGVPADCIIAFAEREDVDMIAMATHGRSGLSHLVMGSVAERVLRGVSVPVLMIRPTIEQHKEEVTETEAQA
jgi:Universal stress protein UspA and related nucleotide-binding proteins